VPPRVLSLLLGWCVVVSMSAPQCLAERFTDSFEGPPLDPGWILKPGAGFFWGSRYQVGPHSGERNLAPYAIGFPETPGKYVAGPLLRRTFASEQSGTVSVYLRRLGISSDEGFGGLQIELDDGGWASIRMVNDTRFVARVCPASVPTFMGGGDTTVHRECAWETTKDVTERNWHHLEISASTDGIALKVDGETLGTRPEITKFRSFGLEVVQLDEPWFFFDDVGVSVGPGSYDLAPPAPSGTLQPYVSNGLGNRDRNVVFDALDDIRITSAGIRIDPLASGPTAIQVAIWEVTPGSGNQGLGTRGSAPLLTAVTSIVDTGLAFYDVPIDFTFQKGHRYSVGFNQAAPYSGWGNNTNMELYRFGRAQPVNPPYQDNRAFIIGGGFSVLNGGYGGDLTQTVLPHIRLNGGLVQ